MQRPWVFRVDGPQTFPVCLSDPSTEEVDCKRRGGEVPRATLDPGPVKAASGPGVCSGPWAGPTTAQDRGARNSFSSSRKDSSEQPDLAVLGIAQHPRARPELWKSKFDNESPEWRRAFRNILRRPWPETKVNGIRDVAGSPPEPALSFTPSRAPSARGGTD